MPRRPLSYADVVSTLALFALFALFAALGGTSPAVKLPHNDIGSAQLRRGAVGSKEIKHGAVDLADMAETTSRSLHGPPGPQGALGPAGAQGAPAPSLSVTVSGAGQLVRGTATSSGHTAVGSGGYTVTFPRDVSDCAYTATPGGIDPSDQPPGYTSVRGDGSNVGVQLYDAAGSTVDRSFHLVVVC